MTDEELAAIRQRMTQGVGSHVDAYSVQRQLDLMALLDEVDRLRAEVELLRGESDEDTSQLATAQDDAKYWRAQVAAMRAIVEAVAHASQPFGTQSGSGVEILYARTGTQEQARALLAKE